MVANLLSRILGFLRESLIAGFFGKTGATDAYNAAFLLPDLLFWLLVGGVISSAFIPVLSDYIAKGHEDEGRRVASSVINIVFLVLGSLIIIGLVLAPQLVRLEVPGLRPDHMILAVHLTRIILLQPLLMALSGLTMGILNSYKIFWPSALGGVLYNVAIIVCGTVFANPNRPGSIAGFAIGVVVGAAANFAVQVPALRRVGWRFYPVIDWRHPGVRRIIWLALPIIISYTINQLQVTINSNLASGLPEGSVTAIWWSYRLYLLPVGIFATAIAVAVFPTLTEMASLHRWGEMRQTVSTAMRTVIFITVPVAVGMIVLRYPLLRVLFQHGQFNTGDTLATAVPLLYFCLGIVAQSVIQILPRAFYALQDTWTPVVMGILATAVNVAVMYILIKPMATGGLALAASAGATFNMAALLFLLRKRLGQMDGRRIMRTCWQTILAGTVMGIVVWLWSETVSKLWGSGQLAAIGILITGSGLGLAVFGLVARLLRMEEYTQALGMVRRRLKHDII